MSRFIIALLMLSALALMPAQSKIMTADQHELEFYELSEDGYWYILSDVHGNWPVKPELTIRYFQENYNVVAEEIETWRDTSTPEYKIAIKVPEYKNTYGEEPRNIVGVEVNAEGRISLTGGAPADLLKKIIDSYLEEFELTGALLTVILGEEYEAFQYIPAMSVQDLYSLTSQGTYADGSAPETPDFEAAEKPYYKERLYQYGAPTYFPPSWPFLDDDKTKNIALSEVPLAPARKGPPPARHLLGDAARALMARYVKLEKLPADVFKEYEGTPPEAADPQPQRSYTKPEVISTETSYIYRGPPQGLVEPDRQDLYKSSTVRDYRYLDIPYNSEALRKVLPTETASHSESDLENLLQRSATAAMAHGFKEDYHVFDWALLSLLCGEDFAEEPAVSILLQLSYIPVNYRINYLLAGINLVLRDDNLAHMIGEPILTVSWVKRTGQIDDRRTPDMRNLQLYIQHKLKPDEMLHGFSSQPLFEDDKELLFENWLREHYNVTYFNRYRYDHDGCSKTNLENFFIFDDIFRQHGIYEVEGQFNCERVGLRIGKLPPEGAARFLSYFAKELGEFGEVTVKFSGSMVQDPAKHHPIVPREDWLAYILSEMYEW